MSFDRPRLLILETSHRCGLVAVGEGESLLGVRQLNEARRHARDLVPAVAELLAAQNWSARNLDAVVISLGPGSYTGLRVGIMSAKALCYATGAPLIGVGTFAALAAQAPAGVGRLDVIADAQQDRVYWQTYRRENAGAMTPVSDLRIRSISDWLTELTADTWVSGPGLEAHAHRLPDSLQRLDPELRTVQATTLLQIGLTRSRAESFDDLWKVEPLYLRPSAAEEQWRTKLGAGSVSDG